MKKVAIIVALMGAVVLAGQSWAGGSCCAGKKSAGVEGCSSALSGLTLTDDQKAKIATIEETCKTEGKSEEACAKAKTQIRDVLTADQKVAFDAALSTQHEEKATKAE